MAPSGKARTRKAINIITDDQDDSDQIADPLADTDQASELFLDPLHGNALIFYVHDDVPDRADVLRLIRIHGGGTSSSYTNASYILVDPTSADGQNLYILFHNNKKGKTVLDSRWVKECVKAQDILAFRANWAGCRVTGNERDEFLRRQEAAAAEPVPPLDDTVAEEVEPDDVDMDAVQAEQPLTRAETPSPVSQQEPVPQQSPSALPDPSRPMHPLYYPSPLIYGYPPPRPGQPMPPMAWPYGHPMPMAVPMFGPPPIPLTDDQEGQVPVPAYAPYDYTQAHAWMEYYAHVGPSMYPGPNDENNPYQFLPPNPDSTENEKKRRGRTRTRNPNNAIISVKPLAPPARSPTPPSRIVKSTYGGNLFTEEDITYLKRYIDYCQQQGMLLSLREICEKLAIRAPHHTFFSWRRYCNKHQIRLGAYTMEDRGGDVDIEVPEDDDPLADTNVAGTSNAGTSKTTRNGSPLPPKVLFKSTTGKGVAFTQEDVQYMVDYMKYRKAQSAEPLDMVEFWNDLAEKAPHHSRASWMKYWRRHRHELEPQGDQPVSAVQAAPMKKSRYTRKDDILLAKHLAQLEGLDKGEKKTSDAMFQAFANEHPHHPWKGWQEHHRIHKTQIDHLIKQLKEGEEL